MPTHVNACQSTFPHRLRSLPVGFLLTSKPFPDFSQLCRTLTHANACQRTFPNRLRSLPVHFRSISGSFPVYFPTTHQLWGYLNFHTLDDGTASSMRDGIFWSSAKLFPMTYSVWVGKNLWTPWWKVVEKFAENCSPRSIFSIKSTVQSPVEEMEICGLQQHCSLCYSLKHCRRT